MSDEFEYSHTQPIPGETVGFQGVPQGQVIKCLSCINDYFQWQQNKPDSDPPEIDDAITWAPSWQSNSIMGQMYFACVMAPSCMRHLGIKQMTPEERAIAGGILLARPKE